MVPDLSTCFAHSRSSVICFMYLTTMYSSVLYKRDLLLKDKINLKVLGGGKIHGCYWKNSLLVHLVHLSVYTYDQY